MIVINKEETAGIPFLHVVEEKKLKSEMPLIFFIHGFTSAKEHNLHYAYLLAEKGFRVILPDALFHGERQQGMNEEELSYSFWDIVVQTIHELNELKEYFSENGLIEANKIGMAGTSMGGMVTLGALTQYDWVQAAVSLMGTPAYITYANGLISELKKKGKQLPFSEKELDDKIQSLERYDLSLHSELLNGRPLLFWHGGADPVVPHKMALQFYQSVKPMYGNKEQDLKFILEPHAAHKVTRKGILMTIDWFLRHLHAK
jgi:fermentation-respiration switch protein FrsA (DUF1100 family)